MTPRIRPLGLAICLVPAAWPVLARAQAADAERIDAARKEGRVVVYATTDAGAAQPLVQDFEALYTGVRVDYRELPSAELHQRFLQESAQGTPSADVLWSSAMDLQVKLANDGHAARYRAAEIDQLPPWAVWREAAYGTTFEPVGLAYNRRLLAENELPRTHADLVKMLGEGTRFHGRVTSYDPAAAGLGFLVATQDARASPLFWDVARALGANAARLQASTAAMLDSLASGQSLLAYNVLGSYTRQRMAGDGAIGLVYFADYTLVVTRVALVARRAAHPQAARLWLDHLLSRRGQQVLAQRSGLASLRADVGGDDTATAVARTLGARLKPIALQPSLMAYLDRSKRAEFLHGWERALAKP